MSMEISVPSINVFDSNILSTAGEKLYLSNDLADVHFIFESEDGKSERVPAHKFFLIAVSKVFRTMFNGSWKENDEVKIPDVSIEAFKEFLQFFYFGRVKLTEANVGAVMDLANQYDIDKGLSICARYLKNIINYENVCWCYGLAILFDQGDLKKSCESMIGLNTNVVFKSKSFLESDRKVMASILKLKWLSCSEFELFEALMAWILADNNQHDLTKNLVRKKYGDLFQNIRIGCIKLKELGDFMREYKTLFTNNEYPDIVQLITDTEYESKIFNCNREHRSTAHSWNNSPPTNLDRFISMYLSAKPYRIESVETTFFSTSNHLRWAGFVLQPVYEYHDDVRYAIDAIPTEISIIKIAVSGHQDSVLYNRRGELKSNEPSEVVLSPCILIRPGFLYKIQLKQNLPQNCGTKSLLKSKVQLDSGTTIQFYRDLALTPEKDFSHGLVRGLLIHELPRFTN